VDEPRAHRPPARRRSSAGAGRTPWRCRAPTTSGRRADPRRASRRGCTARSRSRGSRARAARSPARPWRST
jgi:hypothetical protein